jgi:enoyl-[acyl-carrier-protein] reductase (NADH)
MALLAGKHALIIGLSSDRAIAWGIAQALHSQGAAIGYKFSISCGSFFARRAKNDPQKT